jgi:hypothetical protein
MLPGRYPDVPPRRVDRAVRTMVLATAAALVGVIAGGVSVFAVVSALMAPPRHDLRAAAPKDETAGAPVVTATLQPTPVEPAPASAPVKAQPAPADMPPVAQQPNAWPDALSRAHHAAEPQAPPPVPTVAPQAAPAPPVMPQAPPSAVAKEQVEIKQTNRTADRAADDRRLPPGVGNRAAKPLYDSATQDDNAQAKRRGAVTSRTVQPAPDNNAGASPWERADQNRGFFGRDDRDLLQGMSRDFADRPDVVPRESDLREPRASYGDRNAAKTRAVRPQQRPGDDGDSDSRSLIGNDEWVGEWRH